MALRDPEPLTRSGASQRIIIPDGAPGTRQRLGRPLAELLQIGAAAVLFVVLLVLTWAYV